MYSNNFSSFSVKDILNWTEQQQAHYGMDYNGFNMNPGYYPDYTSRLSDQMGSPMSPMMGSCGGNLPGNSCLYSTNSPPPAQPTYTNLTGNSTISSMTSLSSAMQLPVQMDGGMSPKTEPYDTHNPPTPGSDQDDMHPGSQMSHGPPQPPNLDPGPIMTPNPPHNLPSAQIIKEENSHDDSLLEKGKNTFA